MYYISLRTVRSDCKAGRLILPQYFFALTEHGPGKVPNPRFFLPHLEGMQADAMRHCRGKGRRLSSSNAGPGLRVIEKKVKVPIRLLVCKTTRRRACMRQVGTELTGYSPENYTQQSFAAFVSTYHGIPTSSRACALKNPGPWPTSALGLGARCSRKL